MGFLRLCRNHPPVCHAYNSLSVMNSSSYSCSSSVLQRVFSCLSYLEQFLCNEFFFFGFVGSISFLACLEQLSNSLSSCLLLRFSTEYLLFIMTRTVLEQSPSCLLLLIFLRFSQKLPTVCHASNSQESYKFTPVNHHPSFLRVQILDFARISYRSTAFVYLPALL